MSHNNNLDSEDSFRTGCRNVSHKQKSFSGLQSARKSFSMKVILVSWALLSCHSLHFKGWTRNLNTFKVKFNDCKLKSSDSTRLYATLDVLVPLYYKKVLACLTPYFVLKSWETHDEAVLFVMVSKSDCLRYTILNTMRSLWDISIWILKDNFLSLSTVP